MAIKTYLYTPSTAADKVKDLLTPGSSPVVNAVLGALLVSVSIEETNKEDLDDAMQSLDFSFVAESGSGPANFDFGSIPIVSGGTYNGVTVESHKNRHVSGGSDAFASDDFLEAIVARLRESGGPTTLTLGTVADGQFLQRSGSSLVGASGVGDGTGVWFWGADDLGLTTTTRFLPPGYGLGLALTAQIDLPMPRAGTIKNLFIRQNSPGTGGSNVVYTLTKNGVDTALSVTIASSGTSGSDTANTVTVAQGDHIGIKVTKPLLLLTSPNQVTAGVEFTS